MKISHRFTVAVLFAIQALLGSAASAIETAPIVRLRDDVEPLLMKGAFDELETIAADYRATKARSPGAYWTIELFYSDLSAFADDDCVCRPGGGGKFAFDAKREALERWLAAKPGSLTATIALADLWQRYAWAGRGGDWGGKTGAKQWDAFYDRMARALDLLQPLDPKADPEIYQLKLDATPGVENPKAWLKGVYADAIAAYPDFSHYAATRFQYALSKWYGAPGEAAAFTRSLMTAPGGDAGLIAVFGNARLFAEEMRDYPSALDVTGASFATLVKAFAVRKRTFGPSMADMNVLMFFAIAAQDKRSATLLAHEIGARWSPDVWGDKASFDAAAAWAAQPF